MKIQIIIGDDEYEGEVHLKHKHWSIEFYINGKKLKMNITNDIAANTTETITAKLVDAAQIQRAGDGPFLWTVLPLGIVALLPNTDGSQCALRWLASGAFVVTCSIDADLSPTTKNLITRTITGNALSAPIPQGTDIVFTVGAAVPNV